MCMIKEIKRRLKGDLQVTKSGRDQWIWSIWNHGIKDEKRKRMKKVGCLQTSASSSLGLPPCSKSFFILVIATGTTGPMPALWKVQEERVGREFIWRYNGSELLKLEGRIEHYRVCCMKISGRFGRPRPWGGWLQTLRDREKEEGQKRIHILEAKELQLRQSLHTFNSAVQSQRQGEWRRQTNKRDAHQIWENFPKVTDRLPSGNLVGWQKAEW